MLPTIGYLHSCRGRVVTSHKPAALLADVQPVTIETLRWLVGKAVDVCGKRPVGELRSEENAGGRIGLSARYRFDATQALRQCSRGGSCGNDRP
ncbi:MAG TPA: hypothetical protein VGJ58_02825 [Gaiellaceae bacterium]